jgi:hypothetical protein
MWIMNDHSAQDENKHYDVQKFKAKLLIKIPDSLRVFKKDRAIVRIAKVDLNDSVFFERKEDGGLGNIINDTAWLTPVVEVQLKESSVEEKVKIKRLNNNAIQVVNESKYNEWAFDITPTKPGKITLVVSISAKEKTAFGIYDQDIPLYEKEVEIYATPTEKAIVLWNKYYWVSIIIVIAVFLLIYKLIPSQTIIEYYMPGSNKTNYWNAGALGLVIYIITIISFPIFKIMGVSLFYVPLVFAGSLLLFVVFTAVALRESGKITETNFLKLMGMAFKKVPPLGLFFRDRKRQIPTSKSNSEA